MRGARRHSQEFSCLVQPGTLSDVPCAQTDGQTRAHAFRFPACSLTNIMGIQGLLQFIKEAAEPTHVKKYKGQTVAVDTYCWLHKGAYACAEKLARGEPTDL